MSPAQVVVEVLAGREGHEEDQRAHALGVGSADPSAWSRCTTRLSATSGRASTTA